MKVLHVANGYWPAIGGTEFLIKNVSEHLVTLFGDEVTVFAPNGYNCEAFRDPSAALLPPGTEVINGVTVRRFAIFNRLGPALRYLQQGAYLLRLPGNEVLRTLYNGPIVSGMSRAIGAYQGDVVLASAFPMMHMYHALRGRRDNGLPLVYLGNLHPEERWGFDRPTIYRAIRQADAYIANTAYERDFLIREKGIDPAKITVIGAGVDVDRFVPADGVATRTRYGWGDEPVVAFLGHQSRDKGVDTLVQAMPLVWGELPATRLLIAGSRTDFSPQLRRMVASFPPEQRSQVTIVDDFAEEEKAGLLAACDVFASPSYYESFGIVYVEAWAAGRPVVGCRVGAVSSLISDGEDGLLVPPRDPEALAIAILRLLENPGLRRRLGQRGREKVLAQYTWEMVTRKFRQVYARVIEKIVPG